jgi:Swiss Army Knife protein, DSP-PTPase phosphatase domain
MHRPIPDSYWVVDGLLLAGEYAGASTAARARHKLEALLDAGIRAFFYLTEEGELSPYDDMLRDLADDRGLLVTYDRVPIRDVGVPRPADLRTLLSRLKANVARGTPSYVHCWGGIGRTGTVVGCWLVEHSAMEGKIALKRIAELRRGTPDWSRRSPETDEQSALVLGWAEIRRSMGAVEPAGGSAMATDWFEDLFGFRERSYDETQKNLEVVGTTLHSRVNQHTYAIGELKTPSVKALRDEAARVVDGLRGRLNVSTISGDVRRMHGNPAHRGALFQVASQFNLLEMTGPDVSPEDGVTRYIYDHTQGPACAIAAAAATVYRNYFVPIGGHIGQSRDRQIDCLSDLGAALGNETNDLWDMRNGYALCTEEGLATIARRLDALDVRGVDTLRDLIRIGIHSRVQITDVEHEQLVSQAFCSALPVSHSRIPSERWKSFAILGLEGAYEATLWAAVLNAHDTGSRMLFLTRLGGGAFGNEQAWIHHAMRRALTKVAGIGLDVRVVSHGKADAALERLVAEFG